MEEHCANGAIEEVRQPSQDLEGGGSQQSLIGRFNQLSDEIQLQIDELEEILKEVGQL